MVYCFVCGEDVDNMPQHIEEKGHTNEEMQSGLNEMQPQIGAIEQISRGENFTKQYATNWYVGFTEFDIRVDVMNERRTTPAGRAHPLSPEIITYISECQVISTPTAAKGLVAMLTEVIELYEGQYGEIEMDDGERTSL